MTEPGVETPEGRAKLRQLIAEAKRGEWTDWLVYALTEIDALEFALARCDETVSALRLRVDLIERIAGIERIKE